MTTRSTCLMLGATILLMWGCGSDGSEPNLSSFAGIYHASAATYTASEFTITEAGVTTDLLALGGVLDLTLGQDGRTSGRLFVPGADEDGSDFDRDLVGTWTVSQNVVRLQHEADTFLRDVPFTLAGDLLSGQYQHDDVVVSAVFVRD